MAVSSRTAFKILLSLAVLEILFVLVATSSTVNTRATILMATAHFALWVVLFGGAQYVLRAPAVRVLRAIPLPWQLVFVLACTVLALLEEASATLMTNLASVFGSRIGAAYMTASTNYWDVVLFHSVVVFVPLFIGLSFALRRYAFTSTQLFWLWGCVGVLAETMLSGPQQLLQAPIWIPIYGLMVWLPASAIPEHHGARPVRWWHFAFAFGAMLLSLVVFYAIMVVIGIATGWTPLSGHPGMHFPAITG
jgi:hypothetical protein